MCVSAVCYAIKPAVLKQELQMIDYVMLLIYSDVQTKKGMQCIEEDSTDAIRETEE